MMFDLFPGRSFIDEKQSQRQHRNGNASILCHLPSNEKRGRGSAVVMRVWSSFLLRTDKLLLDVLSDNAYCGISWLTEDFGRIIILY